ncbi:MAG: hypothetical protein PVH68_04010 [Armatimonadota bacterium]|jgi:hypothetical protein
MSISIRFEDDGTLHKDLFVALGGMERRCDTYYFAIDREMEPDREDVGKVRRVLTRLLEQWIDALRNQRKRQVLFLPFDFSDQCTGCFECRRTGDAVQIRMGWSNREGWSFCPSDISDYVRSVRDFEPYENHPTPFARDVLIRSIEQCMQAIAGQ